MKNILTPFLLGMLAVTVLNGCGKREVRPEEVEPPKTVCQEGRLFVWNVGWGRWDVTPYPCGTK